MKLIYLLITAFLYIIKIKGYICIIKIKKDNMKKDCFSRLCYTETSLSRLDETG